MGVTLMENFDCELGALVAKGWVMPTVTLRVVTAIESFTENGITRYCFRHGMSMSYYGYGTYYPVKIPIPASKEFYFSCRLRYPYTTRQSASTTFAITTGSRNAANIMVEIYPNGTTGWTAYPKGALGNTGNPTYSFGHNQWVTVEVLRKADGTLRVWVEDILLYVAGATVTAPTDNFIYLGVSNGAASGDILDSVAFQFADVVVVDPNTAGLQNRPGSTSRVLSAPASADVLAQWTAIGGATGPHNQLMKDFPATVDTTRVLQGDTAGQREQYSLSALPAGFGQQILTLGIEQRANNPGGSPHTFTTEVDTGSGPTGVADNTLAGGSGFQYRPVFIANKPNGSPWSASDIATLKVGFSVKS